MAGNGDLSAHKDTYIGFLTLVKWGTIIVLLLAALVVWLIAA
ncbi:aa3-type cytochrome c oxidase subunit IV [Sphingomonas desiccabilis]|uniref:Aa3-type cytochrome c oxidase subunit IV n=2 Tax=Sphingomonas desiccabilis TaxID=429134 RepID=A0A4Q2IS05_9SPHN|nr:aa3-type cytochrome c oxidase subunit IV [Sphingomonas desiccabilis]RXZ30646.1 aa3-type cytochrome c oxidase subunit IV [Sphingomonas desiccabilis]